MFTINDPRNVGRGLLHTYGPGMNCDCKQIVWYWPVSERYLRQQHSAVAALHLWTATMVYWWFMNRLWETILC